jgi:hypothetical protein
MPDRPLRQSITPTYDSRQTGDRYHVTYRINNRTLTFQDPVPDPFVRAVVHVSWWDRVKSFWRKDFTVEVLVGADLDLVETVLELDDNYLGTGNSTRRQEWNSTLNHAIRDFIEGGEADV